MNKRLEKVIVSPKLSISEIIPLMERSSQGVLLLCDDDRKLVGILTDGDIRRAILRGISFEQPCLAIACQEPLVGPEHISVQEALRLMDEGKGFSVDHLPLVDAENRVVNLLRRRDFTVQKQLPISAVIVAGGYGTRLRPLTDKVPKPMLPVGDRPLIERTIESLRKAGIRHVEVTTHHKSEVISEHLGNGSAFGIEIGYTNEDNPLGTAGALRLMKTPRESLLVVNGDILTNLDFRAMLGFHQEHKADMTVGVRRYELRLPYGVVETEGENISRLTEKPELIFLINAGVYILEPDVYRYIPRGKRFDMTDLMNKLLAKKRRVMSFPIVEYWLDIGQHADYAQAQDDLKNWRLEP